MDLSTTLMNFRRKVAGLGAMALVASLFATSVVSAQTSQIYSDVPADAWFAEAVNRLAKDGILDTTQNNYRPADNVNRAEMAKLAIEGAGIPLETAPSAPFTDVPMGEWYTNYVYTAEKYGIVAGDTNASGQRTGTYRPGDSLNRAEAAKIMVGAFQVEMNTAGGPHFPDVAMGEWYYNYVESAYNAAIVQGNPDGTYRPAANINRAEIAVMVDRALNVTVEDVFKLSSAAAAANNKVELIFNMNVDNTTAAVAANYKIEDSNGNALAVTAAQVVDTDTVHLTTATQESGKVYYVTVSSVRSQADDMLGANFNKSSFLGFGADVSGGALTVALSTQTPTAGSIPNNATAVTFTCWDFTAGSEAVVLRGLSPRRVGAGAISDFDQVYLYRGSERITSGRTLNSDSNKATFSNINQTIAAGQSAQICLVADLSTSTVSGGVHAFELVAAEDVVSNTSSLSGSFPMRGNDQLLTNAQVGTTSIARNGILDEATIGDKDVRVAQFRLEADGVEDQDFSRIALYVRGSIRASDLTNLKLYVTGQTEPLATAATVNNRDYVTFALNQPYRLNRGQNRVFYVTADIMGRSGDTIRMFLDETTDLFVKGRTYGYGTRVTNNYNGTGTAFSEVEVKGGKFNIAFTGPQAGDIAVNQKQASCLDLTITNSAGSDLRLRNWKFNIQALNNKDGLYAAADGASPNFTLFRLAKINDDGTISQTIMGPSELPAGAGSDTSRDITLSNEYDIKSGESIKVALVFDVANNVFLDEERIRCTLIAPTAGNIRDVDNRDLPSADITPNTNIQGNTMNIVLSALNVTRSNVVSSKTYTRGTNGADLLALELRAGSTSDIKVSTISLKVDASEVPPAATNPANLINSLQLFDGSTAVSTSPRNVINVSGGTGEILFTGLNLTIPRDTSKVITLRGNIDSSLIGTYTIRAYADEVLAEDNAGSTLNGSVATIDTAAEAPIMTLIDSVAVTSEGLAVTSSIPSLVTTGVSEPTALRFTLKTNQGTATLRDFNIGVTGDAIVNTVSVFTGNTCSTPVASAQNVSVGAADRLAKVTNANIALSTTDTILCVKAKAKELDTTDVEETTYSLNVAAFTRVTDSSGNDVSIDLYTVNSLETATVADAVLTTVTVSDSAVFAVGQTLQVGTERMQITAIPNATTLTVIRGVQNTTAIAHAAETIEVTSIVGADEFTVYSSAPIQIQVLDSAPTVTSIDPALTYSKRKIGELNMTIAGGSVRLVEITSAVEAGYTCELRDGATVYPIAAGVADFGLTGLLLTDGAQKLDVFCQAVGVTSAAAIEFTDLTFRSEKGTLFEYTHLFEEITRTTVNTMSL